MCPYGMYEYIILTTYIQSRYRNPFRPESVLYDYMGTRSLRVRTRTFQLFFGWDFAGTMLRRFAMHWSALCLGLGNVLI